MPCWIWCQCGSPIHGLRDCETMARTIQNAKDDEFWKIERNHGCRSPRKLQNCCRERFVEDFVQDWNLLAHFLFRSSDFRSHWSWRRSNWHKFQGNNKPNWWNEPRGHCLRNYYDATRVCRKETRQLRLLQTCTKLGRIPRKLR